MEQAAGEQVCTCVCVCGRRGTGERNDLSAQPDVEGRIWGNNRGTRAKSLWLQR